MNLEIAKNWEAALNAFNKAKAAFKNGESDENVKEKLHVAIFYGHCMTRYLGLGGEENLISAGIVTESIFEKFNHLTTKDEINETLKALNEYHNLVPKDYDLPKPIDLN